MSTNILFILLPILICIKKGKIQFNHEQIILPAYINKSFNGLPSTFLKEKLLLQSLYSRPKVEKYIPSTITFLKAKINVLEYFLHPTDLNIASIFIF